MTRIRFSQDGKIFITLASPSNIKERAMEIHDWREDLYFSGIFENPHTGVKFTTMLQQWHCRKCEEKLILIAEVHFPIRCGCKGLVKKEIPKAPMPKEMEAVEKRDYPAKKQRRK